MWSKESEVLVQSLWSFRITDPVRSWAWGCLDTPKRRLRIRIWFKMPLLMVGWWLGGRKDYLLKGMNEWMNEWMCVCVPSCVWLYAAPWPVALQAPQFSSVQSLSRVYSLQPHGLLHTRLPCPSPAPGACSNSCPSSRWCQAPQSMEFSSKNAEASCHFLLQTLICLQIKITSLSWASERWSLESVTLQVPLWSNTVVLFIILASYISLPL